MRIDAYKSLSRHRVTTGPLASSDREGNNGAFLIPFAHDAANSLTIGTGVGAAKHVLVVIASDGEIFTQIKGYEGLYEISTRGRVRSLEKKVPVPNGGSRNHSQIILAPENVEGYLRVTLQKDGIRDKRLIHVIAAETFIDNPQGFPQVNHIDGNKANCEVWNLEWCTEEYNHHHAIENGLRTGFTAEAIAGIKAMIDQGMTPTQIAKKLGTRRQTISGIKHGHHRNLSPDQPCGWSGPDIFWDHVSVHVRVDIRGELRQRVPSWDEMCFVKDLFFDPEEAAMQLHPPKSLYVNHHGFVLHLWRSHNRSIQMPPLFMV